eukprot:TRINITY_DN3985_c0_g6_i1.p1 TRINITY_DN3985_c0_g6~~TRINITY_DN3985_c0_g6_i1.p1  ORF type:complete len:273 (+),score=126.55 TRINITY_DN3985_c0_g6_i1:87-821(+)
MADESFRKLQASKGFLSENKILSLLEQFTAELVQHKPNQPIDYLIERLKAVKGGVAIDSKRPHVVFVLGGPGSGKGMQCSNIVDEYGSVRLSTGDLLRDQVRQGTPEGNEIAKYVKKNELVPPEIIISLLRNEIAKHGEGQTFLVDGFPRDLTQAMQFEKQVCECTFVLDFSAPEATLRDRLRKRGTISGRTDDTPEAIDQRLAYYNAKTGPVLEYYKALGKLRTIDASGTPDQIWKAVCPLFK